MTESMRLDPCKVWTRIGQKEARLTTTSFMRNSAPKSKIMTGSSATTGNDRPKSTMNLVDRNSH